MRRGFERGAVAYQEVVNNRHFQFGISAMIQLINVEALVLKVSFTKELTDHKKLYYNAIIRSYFSTAIGGCMLAARVLAFAYYPDHTKDEPHDKAFHLRLADALFQRYIRDELVTLATTRYGIELYGNSFINEALLICLLDLI